MSPKILTTALVPSSPRNLNIFEASLKIKKVIIEIKRITHESSNFVKN